MLVFFYLLGFVWCLPHTLFSLVMAVWYRAHSFRWSDGCLECIAGKKGDRTRIIGGFGAQCFASPVIFYDSEASRAKVEKRRHERTHTLHGMILGLLYTPLYLANWLLVAIFAMPDEPEGWPAWKRAYRAIWFEQKARERAQREECWGT